MKNTNTMAPDEQDEELHRDLGHGVEQQAEAALRDRFAGEIALHLGLVAAEIGQRQEHAADQAAPEVVAVVPIEVQIHGVQPARRAGELHRVEERDVVRQQQNRDDQRQHQRDDDHAHLLHVGPGDRLDAARWPCR